MKTQLHHIVFSNAELSTNISLYLQGGGGGERQNPRNSQLTTDRCELEVIRSEIMTPLRNAMRLINRDQGDFYAFKLFLKFCVTELLG